LESQLRVVAVTGATGFVGRHVVRRLVERGHEVRCLVRDREKGAGVLPSPGAHDGPGTVRWVIGDIEDREALADLVAGVDAAVHTIGIRREFKPEVSFAKLHPGATRRILGACAEAGVRRYIHLSALGTRPDAETDYHRSKYESERIVRASGTDWTILRPSVIHGPDGEFMQMAKSWVLGRSAPWFFIPYFARVEVEAGFPPSAPRLTSAEVQPVYVGDVAECAARCLEREASIGEVYTLTGPERYDWPTMMRMIRDALPMTDTKKRVVPIPGRIGEVNAKVAEAIGLGAALPFGPSEPVMAMEDSIASTTKAEAHLGMEFEDFAETLGAYASQI